MHRIDWSENVVLSRHKLLFYISCLMTLCSWLPSYKTTCCVFKDYSGMGKLYNRPSLFLTSSVIAVKPRNHVPTPQFSYLWKEGLELYTFWGFGLWTLWPVGAKLFWFPSVPRDRLNYCRIEILLNQILRLMLPQICWAASPLGAPIWQRTIDPVNMQ